MSRYLYFITVVFLLSCKDSKQIENHVTPDYSEENYALLKENVVALAKKKSKLPDTVFASATLENADLLRELVHFENYRNRASARRPNREQYNEIGYMFKDSVGENCGFMGITLYDIYRSLGFKVRMYDVIDGTLHGFLKYRDSHIFVEVYIPELEKYVVQDPTINNSMFSCKDSTRLSFEEIRKTIIIDNQLPCFLSTKVSKWYSPSKNLTERQKISMFEDYYTASVLSIKMFDGEKETKSKLHDFKIIANEKMRLESLDSLKMLCISCKLGEGIYLEKRALQNFMKCLNSKKLIHGVLTTSFDNTEKGFLLQYTNEKGQNVIYDPLNDWYLDKSYFSYRYWNLNNRGYLKNNDLKYMVPLKFYSYRTNQVFEF